MREILFRGKRIDNGEWVYGYYARKGADKESFRHYICVSTFSSDYQSNYTYPFYLYDYEVDPSTVEQYTGLTDKNGKKIFEGDILEQVLEDDDCVIRAFIVWHGSGWAFKEKRFSPNLILSCSECEPYEIIGNIYDNPELLEVNNNG